jgi:hypothetical protein
MLVAVIAAPLALAVLTAPRPAAQNSQIPPGARAEAPDPNIPLYFEAASVRPNKEGGPEPESSEGPADA